MFVAAPGPVSFFGLLMRQSDIVPEYYGPSKVLKGLPLVRTYATTGRDTAAVTAGVDFLMIEGDWEE